MIDKTSLAEIENLRPNRRAHSYVEARLLACNAALVLRSLSGGWDLELKPWLLAQAMGCLRGGCEPYISEADLEAAIAGWVEIGRQRKASAAMVHAGNFGRVADRVTSEAMT